MKEKLRSLLLVLIGTFLTSVGIALFYVPNKVVSGGVSGLATVFFYTFGFPAGISIAVLNIILLIFGLRFLGKSFIIKTVVGSLLISAMVGLLENLPPITNDIILASVVGAALYGFGISLTFVGGASTGGTDILGRILQHFMPHLPIGKLILIVDAAIIGIAFFTLEGNYNEKIDRTIYGIIALFIASFAIDWLMKKLNVSKLAFVVTEKGEEMAKFLTDNSPRGVTIIDVKGGYTFCDKKMLICALKEKEMPIFEERVKGFDDKAFTIFSESTEIVGNGFYLYR